MTYDTINTAPTIADNITGTMLANRYRVVRSLGGGGMGSVWLVEDVKLDNKTFAVKMLPAILVSNKRAYGQLKDEALVAMKLTHPNIVTLRAFEENNGNPFLVMDYIDGQTLDDYLAEHALSLGEAASRRFNSAQVGEAASRRFTETTGVSPVARGLSEADVLRILRPIAAALDYAHAKGVVHRDVKPSNVMIAKDGTPYILDFGIAREIQETMTRVTGKFSSGTLMYMSPEQLHGAAPKAAQDVYSFAAVAYECLMGAPPFSRGQIEYQIDHDAPAPINLPTSGSSPRGSGTLAATSGEAPRGSGTIAASVMAGLAKKPEDRPATCAAVLEGDGFSRKDRTDAGAVALVATEERVEGKTPDGGKGKFSRKKVIIGIVVAFLSACAGGVWWIGRSAREAERAKSEWEQRERKGADAADNGHTKVQLWEGGPYWADTNIGAEKPWEYGYYFWWGDTIGYKRVNGVWVATDGSAFNFSFGSSSTATYEMDISTLKSKGWTTSENVLAPEHDAAHVHWGGRWRMPTAHELDNLTSKCDWTWTAMNGINGYVVRGRGVYASASIFLPAAGHGGKSFRNVRVTSKGVDADGTSLVSVGLSGPYWSSVPNSNNNYYFSWLLDFMSSFYDSRDERRDYGCPVRPVQGFTK